jgi:riboflavin biosynthesis pyrimidine reductase
MTPSADELAATAAEVTYLRPLSCGRLDLAAALGELSRTFGVRLLLCEGGPHLARELLAAGLLDDLFLSLSPVLAGGDPAQGTAMRILAGPELVPPVEIEPRDALAADGHLFLHYGVVAPERVSWETTSSSSLASGRP